MHQDVLDWGGEGQRQRAHASFLLHDGLQLHTVPKDKFDLQYNTASVRGLDSS